MSHFSESRPPSGLESLPTSIISLSSGQNDKKEAVSKLTKNLMSSSARYVPPHMDPMTDGEPPRQPPSYSASFSTHKTFLPVNLLGSHPQASQTSSFDSREFDTGPGSRGALFNGNQNYIPSGHKATTAVSTSYTPNYSHTLYFNSAMTHSSSQGHSIPNPSLNMHPGGILESYKSTAMPITTVSMDSARMNIPSHSTNTIPEPVPYLQPYRFPTQLSNSFVSNGGENGWSIHRGILLRNDFTSGHAGKYYIHHNNQHPNNDNQAKFQISQHNKDIYNIYDAGQYLVKPSDLFNGEPDHYMTYIEYLDLLNCKDAKGAGENDEYEEHFNIVDFCVDELITMLACLLTKIIDTNDKLHPNHFDNTIATRQKLKEQKRIKKMKSEGRATEKSTETSVSHNSDGISTTVTRGSNDEQSDNSEEEEDELKNRYLENVLAFHGTNVPGISLHAYLTRVLKYCPVTNEVFLSLLVYFDRIAKRANNLKKRKRNEVDGEAPEQLFVMDSYNIHRLIILGITVSSKFFSDVFYKNLRYAKVGGLQLEELNYLELQFLLLLDFKLMISVEDLQNYGDLLLMFWKREQLASEIKKHEDDGKGRV